MAVAVRSTVKPEEHAISASMLAKQNLDEYQMYMDSSGTGDQSFVYCHLLIQRKAAATPLTMRRQVGTRCTAVELEALLAWERAKISRDLTGARLDISPEMSLEVRHALKKGSLHRSSTGFPYRIRSLKRSQYPSGWPNS